MPYWRSHASHKIESLKFSWFFFHSFIVHVNTHEESGNFSTYFLEPVCPELVVIVDTLYLFFSLRQSKGPLTLPFANKFTQTQTLAACQSLSFAAAAIYNCQVAMTVTFFVLSKRLLRSSTYWYSLFCPEAFLQESAFALSTDVSLIRIKRQLLEVSSEF